MGLAADEILEAIRAGGGRLTSSRRAVVEALVDSTGHPTADELIAAVRRAHHEMAESTVYRTLEALQELGVVEHVHLGHGPAVFHLAGDRHHHLVCDGCGIVIEVPPAVFDGMAATIERDYGFEASPGHFAVPGLCRSCRASKP